jgi:hypothetical protein
MISISIKFQDKTPYEYNNVLFCKALLAIDEFEEVLMVPIEHWTIEDYEQQWKEGLERIKIKYYSCLITSVYNPKIKPWIEFWPMWKVGNRLYIENQYIFFEIYKKVIKDRPFTIRNCYNYIPKKRTISRSERKPSIWIVDLPKEYLSRSPIQTHHKRTRWSL